MVAANGAGVPNVKVGDRVAYGRHHRLLIPSARLIVADKLLVLPDAIERPFSAAALRTSRTDRGGPAAARFKVAEGPSVLFHARRSVAHHRLPMGAALGATVIGTVGSYEKACVRAATCCHHNHQLPQRGLRGAGQRVNPAARVSDVVLTRLGQDPSPFARMHKAVRLLVGYGQSSGARRRST